MIWLITGSRHAPEREVKAILDTMKATHGKPTLLLHGNADGADTWADEWALNVGVHPIGMSALWRRKSKAAGPIRNAELLRMAMDLAAVRRVTLLCVAMPGPESSGTVDMITRITDQLGVPNPPGPRMLLEVHKVSR